jgi:hypothetical protein
MEELFPGTGHPGKVPALKKEGNVGTDPNQFFERKPYAQIPGKP